MDPRLQYEQQIAGKLESLPIPDLQDMIWARVKATLDIDLPSDDDGGGTDPSPKPGPRIIGWGLSVFLIAFFSLYFLLNNNNKPATLPTSTPVQSSPFTNTPSQAEGPPENLPVQNQEIPFLSVPQSQSGNEDSLLLNASPGQISIGAIPTDSVAVSQPGNDLAGMVNVPELKKDSVLPKKKRGVSLKDEDYRIVPKKEDN